MSRLTESAKLHIEMARLSAEVLLLSESIVLVRANDELSPSEKKSEVARIEERIRGLRSKLHDLEEAADGLE